jgi:glycosyltransferase involved in cell wall biosynthesis
MDTPLISIITPCLNRADFIAEAIESVVDQHYPNFEHIVMDSGSTDGTLDILRSYPHLRVVSEPDRGMYDGINKGLRLARGEIIGLLNSDDLYAEGCFDAVANAFNQTPQAQAVVGGVTTFTEGPDGPVTIETVPTIEPEEFWVRLTRGHPVTNAWFFRPAVFECVGHFDDRHLYSSDRYFLIRAALDGAVRPISIHKTLYHYRQHGGSATISTVDSRSLEYGRIRIKFLQEDIELIEELLNRPGLPKMIRRLERAELSERCYRLAATAFYHRQWKKAGYAISHGWSRNFLWPLVFTKMAFRRIRKEITGHE